MYDNGGPNLMDFCGDTKILLARSPQRKLSNLVSPVPSNYRYRSRFSKRFVNAKFTLRIRFRTARPGKKYLAVSRFAVTSNKIPCIVHAIRSPKDQNGNFR